MQVIIGSSIALVAIAVLVLDFNAADLCYEKTLNWNAMPPIIQRIRVVRQSVEGFIIEFWHISIVLCMFGYSVLKNLNLLTINLLAAFADVCCRLVLQTLGIYKHSWMSYPLNAPFSSVKFGNSFIIAKHVAQRGRKKKLKISRCHLADYVKGFKVMTPPR